MRIVTFLLIVSSTAPAVATLPPPSEEAKAQAAAAKAKSEWSDKVAQYKLCLAGDRVAAQYRASQGKSAAPSTSPCVDPGPYVASAKPLEGAGAHSPPAAASSPHNSSVTHAELAGSVKK